ncbi:hypothetical protein H0921_13920 [thermophilic bacterium 2918]|uniref:Uncharacterized protein n=1 Tax=Thermogemmata fonticola TaxID=2755323 RepID=A0A7V8VFT6_9BACT|nr:hypothetical protein [Thermogemmata fonticola]
MEDYTPYQQRIIKRYYRHRGQIAWQRLAELVSELYLAEGKRRDRLWEDVAAHLRALEVPEARITHILQQKDPQILARLVKERLQG